MNLEAWLRQDHSLAEQLKVIEGLCRALNDAHGRGVVHRALEPGKIEVASDGSCDLSESTSGAPSPRYRAPEIGEGAAQSPQADIYSAGVILYEMLSGRSPSGERPTPLSDLRPDVSRDLTDAIMGCLEKGPDWRPRDLSYLLQVVGAMRPGARPASRPAARTAEPARGPALKPRRAAAPASRSNVPLLAAVVVLVAGAGAGAWFWFHSQGTEAPGLPRPRPSAVLPPSLAPTPEPSPTPEPTKATPAPVVVATPRATPEPRKLATLEPTPPAATPLPPPITRPAATPEPARTPTPAPAATPPPTPAPTPTPKPAAVAPTPPPEPAVLTTVSPLSVKRPGTTMLDVRGTGLRPDHQARIVRIKEAPTGISVVRQKFVDPTLVKVLVSFDDTVAPGVYAVALADAQGTTTNTLSFTVAR